MAKYKLTEKAYMKRHPGAIIEEFLDAETEVEMLDTAIPGPHMEPLDTAAREAMDRYLKNGAPPDAAKIRALNGPIELNGGLMLPAAGGVDPSTAVLLQKFTAALDVISDNQRVLAEAMARLAA